MKINYDKVRNFNQLILAIAGLAGLAFLIFGGIMVLYELGSYYFDDDDMQIGIIANEETDELLRDSLRKQIISFKEISVLDSENQIFILPVSQADLDEREYVGKEISGLSNSFRSNHKLFAPGSFRGHNNCVIYFSDENISEVVFDFKIGLSEYSLIENNDEKYVFFRGASNDSNGDGYLNRNDFQDIYAYDLNDRKLTNIDVGKNRTAIGISKPDKSNKLIVRLGVDRDEDGEFNRGTEPTVFYEIDIENMKLKQLVNGEHLIKLQELLEGR